LAGSGDITTTCGSNYKFEGKERDTETGNDDFGARYYTSRLGRWLSADWSAVPAPVPYANLTNPQTLNLYAMVSDNPETFADLDGHGCGPAMPGTQPQCKPNGNSPRARGDGPAKQKNGTNTPNSTTQQAQAAQQQNNSIGQYVKGGLKIAVGVGLVLTAAYGDLPGGALGATLIGSATLGGTATAVSGSVDVIGAATHRDVSGANDVLDATGNFPGLAVTAATGNLKAGKVAATISDAATLATNPREAMRNAATAVDAGRTVIATGQMIRQSFSSRVITQVLRAVSSVPIP